MGKCNVKKIVHGAQFRPNGSSVPLAYEIIATSKRSTQFLHDVHGHIMLPNNNTELEELLSYIKNEIARLEAGVTYFMEYSLNGGIGSYRVEKESESGYYRVVETYLGEFSWHTRSISLCINFVDELIEFIRSTYYKIPNDEYDVSSLLAPT